MFNLLLDAAANTSGGGLLGGFGIWGTVAYIAIFGVFIYFVIVRPQKKEQKKSILYRKRPHFLQK